MIKRIISALLLISAYPVSAQKHFNINDFYPIETSHSYVGFSVKYMGYAMVKGRFENFRGTIFYDENRLENTSVSFSIDVASIDSDNDWRDNDLKSPNWLNAETYPKINFTSTSVKISETGFEVIGDLEIKDITKEVVIIMDKPSGVLKDTRGDSQVILTGKTEIDRTDFGIEGKRWSVIKEGLAAVDDKVSIELSILAKRINQANFRNWVRNENNPPGKFYKLINEVGIESALAEFDKIKAAPGSELNAGALNIAGYMLLKEGKTNRALATLKKNMQAFPEISDVYDSYGEALAIAGRLDESREYYEKSLVINPDNQNAKEVLRHLQ